MRIPSLPEPPVEWVNSLNALEEAIKLEDRVLSGLTGVVTEAEKVHDIALSDYITAQFIHEQHSCTFILISSSTVE